MAKKVFTRPDPAVVVQIGREAHLEGRGAVDAVVEWYEAWVRNQARLAGAVSGQELTDWGFRTGADDAARGNLQASPFLADTEADSGYHQGYQAQVEAAAAEGSQPDPEPAVAGREQAVSLWERMGRTHDRRNGKAGS